MALQYKWTAAYSNSIFTVLNCSSGLWLILRMIWWWSNSKGAALCSPIIMLKEKTCNKQFSKCLLTWTFISKLRMVIWSLHYMNRMYNTFSIAWSILGSHLIRIQVASTKNRFTWDTLWLSPIKSFHELFFCEGQHFGSFKMHLPRWQKKKNNKNNNNNKKLVISPTEHCTYSKLLLVHTFCLFNISISFSCFLKPTISSAFCFSNFLFSACNASILWWSWSAESLRPVKKDQSIISTSEGLT